MAIALKNGLDPNKALPEDILLLEMDKDGNLIAVDEYDSAWKRLKFEERTR